MGAEEDVITRRAAFEALWLKEASSVQLERRWLFT